MNITIDNVREVEKFLNKEIPSISDDNPLDPQKVGSLRPTYDNLKINAILVNDEEIDESWIPTEDGFYHFVKDVYEGLDIACNKNKTYETKHLRGQRRVEMQRLQTSIGDNNGPMSLFNLCPSHNVYETKKLTGADKKKYNTNQEFIFAWPEEKLKDRKTAKGSRSDLEIYQVSLEVDGRTRSFVQACRRMAYPESKTWRYYSLDEMDFHEAGRKAFNERLNHVLKNAKGNLLVKDVFYKLLGEFPEVTKFQLLERFEENNYDLEKIKKSLNRTKGNSETRWVWSATQGTLVAKYPSVQRAAKELDMSRSNISNFTDKNETTKGYYITSTCEPPKDLEVVYNKVKYFNQTDKFVAALAKQFILDNKEYYSDIGFRVSNAAIEGTESTQQLAEELGTTIDKVMKIARKSFEHAKSVKRDLGNSNSKESNT